MTRLQRVRALFVLGRTMLRLVRDPGQLDAIFGFVDDLNDPDAIEPMRAHFATQERGAQALREKPRVGTLDLQALARLPVGTLGQAFATHMLARGLDPNAIPTLKADEEWEYVLAHMYEAHDIWHVATGFDTDVPGELGLQAFNLAQFPGRVGLMLLAAGLLNTLIFEPQEREARMDAISAGWKLGRQARPLFGVDWKTWWLRPLSDVRAELGLGDGVQLLEGTEEPGQPDVDLGEDHWGLAVGAGA